MLPQLADLDVAELSSESREALLAARRIYLNDEDAAGVAAELGLSPEELTQRIQKLAAEWREQSGLVALPRHTDEEYAALRDSIAEHGQWIEILVDRSTGRVLDGLARQRACRELGIAPRIKEIDVPAELQKSLALVVNIARRHLTASARRGIVRAELLRDATRSDRAIAGLVGVSHPTVAAVRRELEQSGDVERLSTRTDSAGREQPARKPAAANDKPEEPELPDGLVDVTLRLTREYADRLDGGKWLDCRAMRLVLVAPGTYVLEVKD